MGGIGLNDRKSALRNGDPTGFGLWFIVGMIIEIFYSMRSVVRNSNFIILRDFYIEVKLNPK